MADHDEEIQITRVRVALSRVRAQEEKWITDNSSPDEVPTISCAHPYASAEAEPNSQTSKLEDLGEKTRLPLPGHTQDADRNVSKSFRSESPANSL